jgi:hypothetical protein
MTTGFLSCCTPRWHGAVRGWFASAIAEGTTDPVAVVTAVRGLIAEDMLLATTPGEAALYSSMLAVLAHHQVQARAYAQDLLERCAL